jgi:hypothetical protein
MNEVNASNIPILLTSPTSNQARRLLRWTALKPSLQTSCLDGAPAVTRLKNLNGPLLREGAVAGGHHPG